MLLDYGANPAVSDLEGWTPLITAASKGHLEVVRKLLSSGADVFASITRGETCGTSIHLASGNSHIEVVQLLLEAGVDANLSARDGSSPLHHAFRRGHYEVVRVLLENQASLDLQDFFGCLPFQYASIELRERIPEWESYADPTEEARQQKIRESIQTIAATAIPGEKKDFALLGILGRCLLLLKDFPSASVVFDQNFQVEPASGKPTHNAFCSVCDDELFTKRYIRTVCYGRSLCAPCMIKYIIGDQSSWCTGHEFFCSPSDDWETNHQTDVYTETFAEWLKALSLRYNIAI